MKGRRWFWYISLSLWDIVGEIFFLVEWNLNILLRFSDSLICYTEQGMKNLKKQIFECRSSELGFNSIKILVSDSKFIKNPFWGSRFVSSRGVGPQVCDSNRNLCMLGFLGGRDRLNYDTRLCGFFVRDSKVFTFTIKQNDKQLNQNQQ